MMFQTILPVKGWSGVLALKLLLIEALAYAAPTLIVQASEARTLEVTEEADYFGEDYQVLRGVELERFGLARNQGL